MTEFSISESLDVRSTDMEVLAGTFTIIGMKEGLAGIEIVTVAGC